MPNAGQPKSSQKTLEAKDRQRRAIEMRLTGMGLQDIADQLGYSDASGAFRAIKRGMEKSVREPAEQLLTMELMRLDDLLQAHFPLAKSGDTRSAELVLKVMERRSKYLGMDAPEKIDLTGQMTQTVQLVGISEGDV
jgi:hypothetical protein